MKILPQVPNRLNRNTPSQIGLDHNKYLGLAIGLLVTGFCLSFVNTPVRAESNKQSIEKPADGKGNLPSFAQADINGDHYLTKDELKNFPYMLQVFDKVDAGEDGKLEPLEYQNLIMETKREGQVR